MLITLQRERILSSMEDILYRKVYSLYERIALSE